MLCRDLIAAGFETIGDLLQFFPRDHISYGKFNPLSAELQCDLLHSSL